MSTVTDALRNLHQIHIQLEEARSELVKGPRVIQGRKKLIEQKEAEIQSQQEFIRQAKLTAERKALDLKVLEKKLDDLQGKLNTASSNREFDIIKGQIQADTMAKSVLEDETIELYDKVDSESAKLPELERIIQASRQELKEFADRFERTQQELLSRISVLERDLAAAEKVIPSEPAEKYRRLVAGNGSRALAVVKTGSCSNCFVQLTPQQRILIKSDSYLFCTNCGSMLYGE